jgi:hypothetical protein
MDFGIGIVRLLAKGQSESDHPEMWLLAESHAVETEFLKSIVV